MEQSGARPRPDEEASWIKRTAEGDRGAFEELYSVYQVRLFRYFFAMVHDVESAEELTNDVMVEVWKGAERFKFLSKPSTWIFGIAHHKGLNAIRRSQPRTVGLETAGHVTDPSEGPEDRAARQSVQGAIKSALLRLSPEHREVMELTFYHGLSYQEIGEITQCPINTVKTRMFYAKKQIQQILKKVDVEGEMT